MRRLPGSLDARGCAAGTEALGIEANGAIKGCPSLPSTPYTGGNVRERTLREIVERAPELTFNAGAPTDHLWGFCGGCEFAAACRGGCSWTAHVFFNRRGNNPYCHHRALVRAAEGKRERVHLKMASLVKRPFDYGTFGLREEDFDAAWPDGDPHRFTLDGGVGAVRVWELLPDQATDPFTAALACELDPAGSVGVHVQTADVEIVVCLEGAGTATVDGVAHELCPGAALYLPLGGRLALRNDARDAPLRYLIIKAAARPPRASSPGATAS